MNQQIPLEKGLTQLDMIAFASRQAIRLGWELCAITPITTETGYAICKRPMPAGATGEYSTHLVSVVSNGAGSFCVEFISGHYDMKYSLAMRNYLSRVADEIKHSTREY